MKPYVVIRWDKDIVSLNGIRRLAERDTGRFYVNEVEKYQWENDGEWDAPFYFTDTANDAEELVRMLQKNNPYNSYLIAESQKMYQVKPGPVVCGLFTEDGFVPG